MKTFFQRLLVTILLSSSTLLAQESFCRQVFDHRTGSYVEVTSLFGKLPTSGYAPVRVTIANRTKLPTSLTLQFRAESKSNYNHEDLAVKSTFYVTASADQVHSQDLMVPVAALVKNLGYSYGGPLALQVNAYGIISGSFSQSSPALSDFPQLLMSESLYTPNASALDAALNGKGASSVRSGQETFAGKFEPSQMPEDWRAYLGYDGMMMTTDDWQKMTPGSRSAVLLWNRNGGWLQLFSQQQTIELTSLGIVCDDAQQGYRGKGKVEIQQIESTLDLDPSAWVSRLTKSTVPSRQAEVLQSDYPTATWPLRMLMEKKTFHLISFIILLVAFGILVGPINLFVFAKSGQRHKLFITTPLISIGASLVMVILIFIQDGLGGHGVRAQWIHLVNVEGDHHAYVHQEQLSRTGVLLGSRFSLSEPCLLTPLPLEKSPWTRMGPFDGPAQSFELLDQGSELKAAGDWFQSRSEQAQLLQTIRPSRARIESTDAQNPTKLMSNLDYSLRVLFIRDRQGSIWKAESIEPGKSFVVQPSSEEDWSRFFQEQVGGMSLTQQQRIRELWERKSLFVAAADEAPMIETSKSIHWEKNRTIVTGSIIPRDAL